MDDFTSACGEDDIVGVHCTHGVNRSGYLICRYLVQQLGWKLDDCLKAFEAARGYPIERRIYLNALQRTPREKVDTSKISAELPASQPPAIRKRVPFKHPYPMPPNFAAKRRGFAKDGGPFSLLPPPPPPPPPPPHFAFGGPPPAPFRSMPPLGMLPPPPPPPAPSPLGHPPPMYRPRLFRYGPPPRPAMHPPPPGFPVPGFPPPCPSRTGRLPPRLPASKMPPPPTPPPPPPPPPPAPPILPPSRLKHQAMPKRLQPQKRKSQVRNGFVTPVRNTVDRLRQTSQSGCDRILPKLMKEQDFTVDTFEENLLAVVSSQSSGRRSARGRFRQIK